MNRLIACSTSWDPLFTGTFENDVAPRVHAQTHTHTQGARPENLVSMLYAQFSLLRAGRAERVYTERVWERG